MLWALNNEKWLRKKADSISEQNIKFYCTELGIKPPQLVVKNLKNRWGSATKDNVINLNVNLLKAPESVIKYIILHELCHLKIKEHSHHFWDLLHMFMPDYQKNIKWLQTNGRNLVKGTDLQTKWYWLSTKNKLDYTQVLC